MFEMGVLATFGVLSAIYVGVFLVAEIIFMQDQPASGYEVAEKAAKGHH